jgi:hypothetical protein
MERTEPAPRETRIGPAEKPDDPLAAARLKATREPRITTAHRRDRARNPAPPTPDLEGCYYLG